MPFLRPGALDGRLSFVSLDWESRSELLVDWTLNLEVSPPLVTAAADACEPFAPDRCVISAGSP